MNSIRIIEQFSGCVAEPDAGSFSIIVSSEKSRFDTSTVTLYPAPSDIRISLRCPMKLSDSEAGRLSGFISDHNAALHRSGFHLHVFEDHLCLRSSLYIEDMSAGDGCDALGSMISAMMEKMTLIESGFLQSLFSADTDSSAICEDDSASPACMEETSNPEEPAEPSLPAERAPYACEYPWMDENDRFLLDEDDFESYDGTNPPRNEPQPLIGEEPDPYADVEDEPPEGKEDEPICDADVQPESPPPYPDLSIDLSNPRLRSLFTIQPIVNLRREFKLPIPSFDDLLRGSNQTESIREDSES